MGKSASGKDAIYRRMIAERVGNLKGIVPYTTRPKRIKEEDGRDYFFVSEEKMTEMEAAGKIIERRAYNVVGGVWYYFTADDGQIDLDSGSYLIIGTLEAYIKFREYFGADKLVPLYVEVEDGERLSRALRREMKQPRPAYEEMCRRFLADSADFSEEKLEAAGITRRFSNTGTLEECFSEICAAVISEA